jgi:hypothetical protein
MTLAIARFHTRCRAGPRTAFDLATIEKVVREEFPMHCARLLGVAFAHHRGVVRLKRLGLKLHVEGGNFDKQQLAQQWSAAFAEALRHALARPASVDLIRYEESSQWIAAVIEALLTSSVRGDWRFREYESLADLPLDQALAQMLEAIPAEDKRLESILVAVARRGAALPLLRALSDSTLERWVVHLDAAAPVAVATPEQILAPVETLLDLSKSSPASSFQSARVALLVWLQTCVDGSSSAWSVTRSALLFVDVAIRALRDRGGAERLSAYAPELPAIEYAALLRNILSEPADGERPRTPTITALREQLQGLSSMQSATTTTSERVYSTDFAGLLLLIGSVASLNWPQRMRDSALSQRLRERLLTYLLAEIGLCVARHAGLACDRDPAIAIFAGWFEEPNWLGLERLRTTVTAEECADLSRAIDVESHAITWPLLVEHCTRTVLRQFGGGIRGFRDASEAFIARKLLAVRGELRIDEQRIAVVLAPSPYHVALHVCSGFTKLEAVSWLGWRDVVFHPGGE